jgi:pimeloyl-ACP methyl ester carboxylesterase
VVRPIVALACQDSGTGEPVVLLHGLGSRGADWDLQQRALSGQYRVLALDLRGHGESPHPTGAWEMADFAEDVAALLRERGTGPAHLVGLSLGGMVAFQLLADHPDLVRSAVIVNSGPAFPGRTLLGRLLIWSRLLLLRWKGLPALGNTIARRLFPKPEQQDMQRRFMAGFVRNDPGSYARTLRAIQQFDVAAAARRIRVPVLAISGDRDYTPVEAKAAWVRGIPGARLLAIPDSGHATPIDQPDALNVALLQFLASTRTST